MSKRSGFILKPFRDIPIMLGYSHIKSGAQTVRGLYASLLKMPAMNAAAERETFEELRARLNISDEALLVRLRQLMLCALIYCLAGIALIVYAAVMYKRSFYMASLSCVSLSTMVFSFGFREHFWYIQFKYKRLGLTFKQWLQATIYGDIV
jgi:hypothetical protein